jgi:hypothetical protein
MSLNADSLSILLTQRVNKLFAALSYSVETFDTLDATNYALRELGYTVTNAAIITDSDVSAVSESDVNQFLDTAELRQLETLQNDFIVKVSMTLGPRREELSHITDALERVIARKQAEMAKKYGRGVATLSGGVIDLAFAETNSTT